jgi:hypothetical protein
MSESGHKKTNFDLINHEAKKYTIAYSQCENTKKNNPEDIFNMITLSV